VPNTLLAQTWPWSVGLEHLVITSTRSEFGAPCPRTVFDTTVILPKAAGWRIAMPAPLLFFIKLFSAT